MRRFFRHFILIVSIFISADLHAQQLPESAGPDEDSITDNQRLYNGKMWRNQYYLVKEDQFLFSREFLPGSISMRGRSFPEVPLKYDLYKDEILTPTNDGILQLNKEMIDSFSLSFQGRKYPFIKLQEDSIKKSMIFFNVAYKGNVSLLFRYSKKIDKLAVEGKYDQFYLITRVFLYKDKKLFQITGKSDLMSIMSDYKTQIKEFMKTNKIKVSEKNPESFVPVVRYYDSLNH